LSRAFQRHTKGIPKANKVQANKVTSTRIREGG
jgi:hypothetical protein